MCVKSLRQVVTATGEAALAATEMERYLAAMQEKTGLVPQQPRVASAHEAASPQSELFTSDMIAQLNTVFDRMESSLVLSLELDNRPVSAELRAYMEELASLSDKVQVSLGTVDALPVDADVAKTEAPAASAESGASQTDTSAEQIYPVVRVLRQDGTPTGLAFHGVPGGHEFTSFVLGLYNAAGPGQPLDEASINAIAAIDYPVDIKVLVSLSCTMCPDTVVAAQRIAADNPHVSAEAYDLNHFPALKERFQVMSVPCVVINDGEQVAFGKKNVAQVLELIGH